MIEDINENSERLILNEISLIYPDLHDIKFFKDRFNKPHIFANGKEKIWCSISHKEILKLIVLSDSVIGIDVESKIIKSELSYLFHNAEQMLMNNHESISLTLMWTLKEAAAKSIGLGLTFGINSVYIYLIDKKCVEFISTKTGFQYMGRYYIFKVKKYIISIIYNVERINYER
ncbi:4'-phosphopantetheinyl transferase family protein [Leuconostoc gelidum]|nr:4'-phosphopantetheinyl transferase superfamily protein [Leuconostoc gelidum]